MSKNTSEPMSADLALLESTDAIFILRYIDRHPMSLQADIIVAEGNNKRTKLVRLKELSDAGLIRTVKDLTKGKAIHYVLTKAGEKVVKRLDQVAEVFDKYEIGRTSGKYYNDRSIIIAVNDPESSIKQIEREVLKNSIKRVYVIEDKNSEENVDELRERFPTLTIEIWEDN